MAFNYNNEIVDLLLKKNLGSAYTTSGLVSGQETLLTARPILAFGILIVELAILYRNIYPI